MLHRASSCGPEAKNAWPGLEADREMLFLVVGMVCHCGLESHSQLLRLPERPLTVSVRQVTVKVV